MQADLEILSTHVAYESAITLGLFYAPAYHNCNHIR